MRYAKPQWRQAAPYAPDPWWYTLALLVRDVAILLVLILGLPFLLWLIGAPK